MNALFFKYHLPSLFRRRLQFGLCVLGITLGVAIVLGVDLASHSALQSFERATNSIHGQTTHRIVGGPTGVPDSLMVDVVQNPYVKAATPFIEFYARIPRLDSINVRVLGIDPLSHFHFQYPPPEPDQTTTMTSGFEFLTHSRAILLSGEFKHTSALQPGDSLVLQIHGRNVHTKLVNWADTPNKTTILMDIATAQELGGKIGFLTSIDLVLKRPFHASVQAVSGLLPDGIYLKQPQYKIQNVRTLVSSYRMNLQAMSLIAVFVGFFLIYNTIMFSILQRRLHMGILRSLGATRKQIRTHILYEALVLGMIGSSIGLVLGLLMTRFLMSSVQTTVSDYYAFLHIGQVYYTVIPFVKAWIIGVVSAVVAAVLPTWEASQVPPHTVSLRSSLESKIKQSPQPLVIIGAICLVIAAGLSRLPHPTPVPGFAAAFFITIGFALMVPFFMIRLLKWAEPLIFRLSGILGLLAGRNISHNLSRTGVALAALMVSLAMAIGMTVMIHSFKTSLARWIDSAINSEFYVTAKLWDGARFDSYLPETVISTVQSMPGVAAVDVYTEAQVEYRNRTILVQAIHPEVLKEHSHFLFRSGSRQHNWDRVARGWVIVSETFASRFNTMAGDTVSLNTLEGKTRFPVAAVFRSYTSDWGQIMMSREQYRKHWQDNRANSMGIYIKEGVNETDFEHRLRQALSGYVLRIYNHAQLRNSVLAVFDRTFAITIVLQFLAMVVAFVGILSAILALLIERSRELGLLRSLGMTLKQLKKMLLYESGWMGMLATLISVPAGLSLALVLIYVINQRSFGWSIGFYIPVGLFFNVFLLALTASLLAVVYPLLRLKRLSVAASMRME